MKSEPGRSMRYVAKKVRLRWHNRSEEPAAESWIIVKMKGDKHQAYQAYYLNKDEFRYFFSDIRRYGTSEAWRKSASDWKMVRKWAYMPKFI